MGLFFFFNERNPFVSRRVFLQFNVSGMKIYINLFVVVLLFGLFAIVVGAAAIHASVISSNKYLICML